MASEANKKRAAALGWAPDRGSHFIAEPDVAEALDAAEARGRREEMRYWFNKLRQWDKALAGILGELCDEGFENVGPYWSVKDVRDEMIDLLEGAESDG